MTYFDIKKLNAYANKLSIIESTIHNHIPKPPAYRGLQITIQNLDEEVFQIFASKYKHANPKSVKRVQTKHQITPKKHVDIIYDRVFNPTKSRLGPLSKEEYNELSQHFDLERKLNYFVQTIIPKKEIELNKGTIESNQYFALKAKYYGKEEHPIFEGLDISVHRIQAETNDYFVKKTMQRGIKTYRVDGYDRTAKFLENALLTMSKEQNYPLNIPKIKNYFKDCQFLLDYVLNKNFEEEKAAQALYRIDKFQKISDVNKNKMLVAKRKIDNWEVPETSQHIKNDLKWLYKLKKFTHEQKDTSLDQKIIDLVTKNVFSYKDIASREFQHAKNSKEIKSTIMDTIIIKTLISQSTLFSLEEKIYLEKKLVDTMTYGYRIESKIRNIELTPSGSFDTPKEP